jgi:hypothetical protein
MRSVFERITDKADTAKPKRSSGGLQHPEKDGCVHLKQQAKRLVTGYPLTASNAPMDACGVAL